MKYLRNFEDDVYKESDDTYNELVEAVKSKFKSYKVNELKIFYSSNEKGCYSEKPFEIDEIKIKNEKFKQIHKNKLGKIYLNWNNVDSLETWELLDVLRYFETVPEEVIENQIAEQEADKFNF